MPDLSQAMNQPKRSLPPETRQRMAKANLSVKQSKFIKEYAASGNATQAAKAAGYKPKAARQMASENLSKPVIASAVAQELARMTVKITPDRVQRRLDEISHEAQESGQFGPAVRAEELLGKSIGMWIDQSIQLSGTLQGSHVAALLEVARKRQLEPIDLKDDGDGTWQQSADERD